MKKEPSGLSFVFDALFSQSVVCQKSSVVSPQKLTGSGKQYRRKGKSLFMRTRSSGWVKSLGLSLLLVILMSSFLVINNSMVQWAASADDAGTDLSDFDSLFTFNSVRMIYPSEQTPKPLNCASAMGTDWAASAFISTKLETVVEGTDTDSAFVNQTSGKPVGAAGTGLISFGGPLVNPVVAYAENEATPAEDRAPVRFYQNEETFCFQLRNGTSVPAAALSLSSMNSNVDMFVIEVYQDGDGRNVMLCYGFGWKGTYAAGKYFAAEIYPNIAACSYSWVIVLWHDSNGNGFVNNAADGDTYIVIATSENHSMQVSDDADWSFRKSHVINSAVGAGTDYQVKVVVHYGSGVDSGENVFLNANCRSDFGDVRFTSDDGVTLLDYWMESMAYYDRAVFWVKVLGDLSSSDQMIYVYYGNGNAASISNGANTFLFFDDFANLNAWTIRSGTWTTTTDGSLTVLQSGSYDNNQIVTSTFSITDGRIRAKIRKQSESVVWHAIIARTPDSNNVYSDGVSTTEYNLVELQKWLSGSKSWVCDTKLYTPDTSYHVQEFLLAGTSLKTTLDDAYVLTGSDSSFSSGPIGFRRGFNGYAFLVDWIFVGKYVSSEPSHGAWGNEEPVAVTGL